MKKKFFLWLPLLGVFWLFSSCKDKTTITVQEFGTKKPIEGAEITLQDCSGELLGNFECFDIGKGTTDSKGKFKTKEPEAYVSAAADNYFPTGDDRIFMNSNSGISKIANLIYLYPYAYLEITFINQSGVYGFRPPVNSSGVPPTNLPKGEAITFHYTEKGNKEFIYPFTIFENATKSIENYTYVLVKNEKNNEILKVIEKPFSNHIILIPEGQDTTKISITF
jgi:hypothetical protein